VPALVDAARRRGQAVELSVTGAPVDLGPLAETAAYRMVQESLANAARHARGAACSVAVAYGETDVRIVVANGSPAEPASTPAAAGSGFGLTGMAERAELVGARVTTGPAPDGGWRNQLTIPYDRNRSDT
jgi:signal transduction histidine kinase